MAERIFIARQDTLEEIGGNVEQGIAALDGKVGTEGDTGTNTIYGLLKNGTKLFKSWNRYTYSCTSNVTSVQIPIQGVDASRCFALVERVANRYDNLVEYSYTLEDTQITLRHGNAADGYLQLAFTVIELY